MALGSIVVDLLMRTGSFETDSKKAERRLREMEKTVKQVGTVIGTAIAGGVTVAVGAMASWTREITELSEQTRILSGLSGTTSTMFQEWAVGSRTVGVEQDKLADILKDVQDKIGDFIQTGGGPMADFFENIAPKVGLTAEQFAKLSGPDALQAYVSALESANLTQADMVFYMEALASDSSKLIPLLADGGEEMRRWGDAAREAGAIMSDEMIAAMRESKENIDELKLAFFGMKVEVVEGITPAVQDFTELLNDPDTREGLSSFANALVTITTKTVEAAAAIGDLIGRYTDFLSRRGFLPTDGNSTLDELEARRAKLEGAAGKADGYFGKLLYGEKTADELRAEIAQVESDIAAFPFRGVSGSASTTASGQPRRGNPYSPDKDKGGKSEEEKALERLQSSYESLSESLTQQIALYGEMGEAAKVRYEIEQGALAGLEPAQAAALIALAERKDALDAETEAWKEWQEEVSAIEQVWADAHQEQTQRVIDSWSSAKDEMSVYAEQAGRNMQDAFADFLFDPFENGLSGMLDSFADILKRMAAEAAAAKIFESLGSYGSANTGTWYGDLLSGFFGGATKAAGGGYIAGPGTATSDSIPAYLSNGEYVINASAVSKYGPSFFDSLNAKRFAAGGYVGNPAPVGTSGMSVQVVNNGPPVQAQASMERGADGQQLLKLVLNAVGDSFASGTGAPYAAAKGRFGLKDAV